MGPVECRRGRTGRLMVGGPVWGGPSGVRLGWRPRQGEPYAKHRCGLCGTVGVGDGKRRGCGRRAAFCELERLRNGHLEAMLLSGGYGRLGTCVRGKGEPHPPRGVGSKSRRFRSCFVLLDFANGLCTLRRADRYELLFILEGSTDDLPWRPARFAGEAKDRRVVDQPIHGRHR